MFLCKRPKYSSIFINQGKKNLFFLYRKPRYPSIFINQGEKKTCPLHKKNHNTHPSSSTKVKKKRPFLLPRADILHGRSDRHTAMACKNPLYQTTLDVSTLSYRLSYYTLYYLNLLSYMLFRVAMKVKLNLFEPIFYFLWCYFLVQVASSTKPPWM